MTEQELKELFELESRAVSHDTPVPAAGQIWWRSAIRARAEDAHAAARPMVWLQALAGAGAVGLVLGGLTTVWPSLQGTVRQFLPAMSLGTALPLPVILAIGAALLAAPIAFYLAVPRD